MLVLVTVCFALKVLLLAKDLKARSIGGCRTTKPEEALGVGLLLMSAYSNGLKRLVIIVLGKL